MNSKNDKLIEELYRKYSKSIYVKCYHLCGNTALAEDAVQEIFIKAYENLDKFKLKESYLPWLYKIANNHCFNIIKRNTIYKKALFKIKSEQFLYENNQGNLSAENVEFLRILLKKLDQKTAKVIIAYYFDGMNMEETADFLSISRKTVSKRINNFILNAQKYLKRLSDGK